MEKILAFAHGHENHSKWKKKKTRRTFVGKKASKNNPKTIKKFINIGVYLNIHVNGRNEIVSLFFNLRSTKSSLLVAIMAIQHSNPPWQQAHSCMLDHHARLKRH